MKSILVTGGAGYIGSHTVRELASNGYRPISLDNLSKGHERAVVAGDLVKGELADEELLESIFQKYSVDAVMHFAALCEVGESVEHPRLYYEQNMVNSLTLLRVMLRHDVRKFILSSTCATYGDPQRIPIDELHPLQPINPYGASKVMVEEVLKEYDRAYGLSFVSLRYFNAAGAEPGGQHGRNSLVDVVQQLDLVAEAVPDMSEQAGHKSCVGPVGPGFGPAVGRHRLVPAGSG